MIFMLNDNSFITWLTLKAFIIKEVSNAIKIVIVFLFLFEIYFLLAHVYFQCNLRNPEEF